jgi:hypothetical protein
LQPEGSSVGDVVFELVPYRLLICSRHGLDARQRRENFESSSNRPSMVFVVFPGATILCSARLISTTDTIRNQSSLSPLTMAISIPGWLLFTWCERRILATLPDGAWPDPPAHQEAFSELKRASSHPSE